MIMGQTNTDTYGTFLNDGSGGFTTGTGVPCAVKAVSQNGGAFEASSYCKPGQLTLGDLDAGRANRSHPRRRLPQTYSIRSMTRLRRSAHTSHAPSSLAMTLPPL